MTLGTRRFQCVHGGEHGVARRRGVLKREYPAACHVGPSILRCKPCAFSAFRTTNASIGVPRLAAACIIAVATGFRAERQAADRVVGQARGGVEQNPADERRQPAVKRHPAQVHVAGRMAAGRQFDVAVHDALGLDPCQQFLTVIHVSRAYEGV